MIIVSWACVGASRKVKCSLLTPLPPHSPQKYNKNIYIVGVQYEKNVLK